jgi:hypothetical protein
VLNIPGVRYVVAFGGAAVGAVGLAVVHGYATFLYTYSTPLTSQYSP